MSGTEPSSRSIRLDVLAAVFLLGVALLTRVYRFGDWSFTSDEYFTVGDALSGSYRWPFKAAYYALVAGMFKLAGVSEWTARLPALVFGILGVLAVYFASKDFVSRSTSFLAALFTVMSSWHLHYSQFARFYSAVFLFGALSYLLYYRAIHKGRVSTLLVALLMNLFGIMFHTTFLIVPGSCALFSLLVLIFFKQLSRQSRRIAGIHLILAAATSLFLVPYSLRVVSRWTATGQDWGYDPLNLILQTAKYIGLGISVGAVFGLIHLVRKDVVKGAFLGASLLCAGAFLLGTSFFASVRPDYIIYVLPLIFLLAAHFCEVLRKGLTEYRIVSYGVPLIMLGVLAPEFVSHYTSRMSLDIRDAIRYVDKSYSEGDKIVSFLGDGGYYWPEYLKLEKLPGTAYKSSVNWDLKLAPYREIRERVWFVVPLRRTDISRGLQEWLFENTALVWQKKSKRYDYTFEAIQIYLKRARLDPTLLTLRGDSQAQLAEQEDQKEPVDP